jgi:hypothetical protein
MGGVEAVALHEAYDRQGVLQGNFLVTIVGSVIALLEACEEQGFDLADFFPAILPGANSRIRYCSGACQCGNFNPPSVMVCRYPRMPAKCMEPPAW